MESDSVAAAMIRRFREAKPSSRAERDSAKLNGRVREMWWVDDADKGRSGKQPPLAGRSFDGMRNSMDTDQPQPRPSPMKPAVKPPVRLSTTVKSIDDLIMKDVMGLNESMDWDNRRKDLFGYDSDASVDNRKAAPAYRYERGRDEQSKFQKSGEALLNESLDTLGSLGFRGLHIPELKLDGKSGPKVEESASQMNEVNSNLEELLKTLGAGKDHLTKEGLPESILQVYNDVNANLLSFKSKFEEKYDREDAEVKQRAERDEEMKNAGREEERENLLKQMSMMELESESRRRKKLVVLASSYSDSGESEYLTSSVEPGPAEDEVRDLRSALQSRMRQLEQMHADAMKETVFMDASKYTTDAPLPSYEAVVNESAASAPTAQIGVVKEQRGAFLYGKSVEPYLDVRFGRESNRNKHRSTEHSDSHLRRRSHSRGRVEDAISRRAGKGARHPDEYVRPDDAAGNAPGILHSSVVSAAKYITLNLNVAMDGLHQRLPAEQSPVPPRKEYVMESHTEPRLPQYHELDLNPRLPSYDEVITAAPPAPMPQVQCPPPLPESRYIPPLSEAEKMSLAIDDALGPIGSSLEESELAWWRKSQGVNDNKHQSRTVTSTSNYAPKITPQVNAEWEAQSVASKSWLNNDSAKKITSLDQPSAPVFPVPTPPPKPNNSHTSSTAVPSASDSFPPYLSNPHTINYNRAHEGMALQSVRAMHDAAYREVSHIPKLQFSPTSAKPDYNTTHSPNSVAIGPPPMTEREMYLKKMQHYRATLSRAVL